MQELLAERDFVRSLARQLLAVGDAEDLVQDTWVAVLRRRPEDVRQPRSWLARVVRRLATNHRRGERRRVRREQEVAAALAVSGPSTAEILACEQVRQRVVAAVLALDEPLRRTVLARFYECLDSEAIARRDSVEVATVRSRLKRALDRLRAQLDAEHGGQREAWAAPLGLLAPSVEVPPIPVSFVMSMPKKAAAVAAVALCTGLVFWSLSVLSPTVHPAPARALASSPGAAASAGDSEVEQRAASRMAVVAAETDRSGPRERPPFPVRDEPIDDVPVRVLDRATRRPVSGAEVVYTPFRVDLEAPSTRGDRVLHEMASSGVFFVERFGSRAHTGVDGAATIRLPRSGGIVLVRHGGRWGRGHILPESKLAEERVVLWLDDSRWVRIRLVDEESGAPVAGELVELSVSTIGPVVPLLSGGGGSLGPSDADGMILWQWRSDCTAVRVRPWTVGASEATAIELPAALDRVTEIRCPPTGSLTVELRTPSGALWPSRILARAMSLGGAASKAGPLALWSSATPGLYQVAHVELGLRWRVSLLLSQRFEEIGATPVEVAGPTRAGEDVRVVLRSRTEPCILRARLRLDDGSLPPPEWQASIWQGAPARQAHGGPLEDEGGLAWTIAPGSEPKGRIELRDRRGKLHCQVDWNLGTPASPGDHDLGTLTAVPVPVVIAGLIEFAATAPPGPIRVQCEALTAGGTWQHLTDVEVHPDVSCAFVVREYTIAQRVRVTVRGDRNRLGPEPVIVDVPARDLRLVFPRSGTLRAHVIAPAAYAQRVTCRAVREDGIALPAEGRDDDDAPKRGEGELVDFDGVGARFLWPALPPGSYCVEVRAPGVAAPLHVVPGVRVEDGAASDPRLDPIDVRERTRLLTIAIDEPPNGPRPITDGGAVAFPTGQERGVRHGMLFDAQGRAELAVGPGPVDVVVAVPGFRLWRAAGVTDSFVPVRLEPCLPVRCRLSPRLATALAGQRVHVTLNPWPADAAAREASPKYQFLRAGDRYPDVTTTWIGLQRLAECGRATLTDSHATGVIPISAIGRFEVELAIETATRWVHLNNATNGGRGSPLQPRFVDVQGADDPVFVLDVEEALLAKTIDELTRPR